MWEREAPNSKLTDAVGEREDQKERADAQGGDPFRNTKVSAANGEGVMLSTSGIQNSPNRSILVERVDHTFVHNPVIYVMIAIRQVYCRKIRRLQK